jgi:hypothetical protein
MSTPLTATAKISFSYRVMGLVHRLDTYMAYNDVLGQHQMVDRDGVTTVLWTLGAQYLWDKMRVLFHPTNVPSPAAISLFQRSGSFWNLIDVANLTGVGSGGDITGAGWQLTWVLRDTAFKKLRFIMLETLFASLDHTPTGESGQGNIEACTDMLDGEDVNASAPYRWMKSRGDRFLAATGVVAGLTSTTNQRIRRARGLT